MKLVLLVSHLVRAGILHQGVLPSGMRNLPAQKDKNGHRLFALLSFPFMEPFEIKRGSFIKHIRHVNCTRNQRAPNMLALTTRHKDVSAVRNYIINKIIGLQYHLRKVLGKKMARYICIGIEKTFTTLFGRERYPNDGL